MNANSDKNQPTLSISADVVLVYPYFYTHAAQSMLFHPLGVARLAAILRNLGIRTSVVDCTFKSLAEAISQIIEACPRLVGIYAMLSISETAMTMADEIRRQLPQALMVCGGPLPTLKPAWFSKTFDAVFRGEAHASFPEFCLDYIASGCGPGDLFRFVDNPEKYPGIYCMPPFGGPAIRSPSRQSDENTLEALPAADRSDYDHRKYQGFWQQREQFSMAGIMTSYGCPFDCEFCSKPIFGNRFRRLSMDRIFEEIRDIKNLGYAGLWIGDDCFSLDLAHVRSFCRRLIAEDLDMKWCCLSRVDRISEDDIALWQEAGCRKVFFGLESGSNDILRLMHKKTNTAAAEKTIRRFAGSDIKTAGFFMVGYPGETPETIETTFQWALSLPLDEISFTVPYPLPGTRLYERVMGVDDTLDWKYENENRLVFASEFDETYLKKRIDCVYKQFEERSAAPRSLAL